MVAVNNREISFDLWGTLIVSNPEFKANQKILVNKLDPTIDVNKWEQYLKEVKAKFNFQVEREGIHCDRKEIYKEVFINQSEAEIDDFIQQSDELFLKYPPLLKDKSFDIIAYLKARDIQCYICSNTVLIYSNVLLPVVYNYFKIMAQYCHFSDVLGTSKPNMRMFDFPFKPDFHVGDNLITDGSCINYDINFYHINETQNFQTFLAHANL